MTPIDEAVMPAEAEAVARAAIDSGVARKPNVKKGWVAENTRQLATFYRQNIDPICDKRKN
jgi:malic enzyme